MTEQASSAGTVPCNVFSTIRVNTGGWMVLATGEHGVPLQIGRPLDTRGQQEDNLRSATAPPLDNNPLARGLLDQDHCTRMTSAHRVMSLIPVRGPRFNPNCAAART